MLILLTGLTIGLVRITPYKDESIYKDIKWRLNDRSGMNFIDILNEILYKTNLYFL